jgi:DNA-binding response OmpR family regulator
MRLLLVEDGHRLRELLQRALMEMGHGVDLAVDGEEGAVMARQVDYDVILLDWLLPGVDGLDVLRGLRRDGVDTPVLMLTALSALEEKVRSLAEGADDYLTKPFELAELGARLEVLARRRYGMAHSLKRVGSLEIDTCRKIATRDGKKIPLTAREFSLLEILARRPGRVLSREQIAHYLYAESDSPQSNAVDVAVYLLRRKLCPPGTAPLIHTRRGLGYVLEYSAVPRKIAATDRS